jgi:hypothetical protein
VVWIVVFFVLFFVLGSAGKAQKKHKKAQKKHEKSTKKAQFLWKKWISGHLASTAFGPAAQQMSHTISFFPTSFPKKTLKSEPMPGAGMWKKCNYHMMFIKHLNNYCWRDAFVTLFTYNLQWLDRLIAVSRYLRYAAFNIVKNVMSHNIVSSYRCNTLHHHTISLPLLFDTQIFR